MGLEIDAEDGTSIKLDYRWYDRHMRSVNHSGPATASVFEIARTLKNPIESAPSRKDADRTIYASECGNLGGKPWYTIVIVGPYEDFPDAVVTAMNVENYKQKMALGA